MDRELSSILRRLISHSAELESSLARSNSNLVEALGELESLEQITHESLFPEAVAPIAAAPVAPQPTISAQAKPQMAPLPPKHAPPSSRQYASSKREYQAALSENDLIEALLRYHQRNAQKKRAAAANPAGDRSSFGFVAASIPEVQAEVKNESGFRRGPGVSYPVLRSKRD